MVFNIRKGIKLYLFVSGGLEVYPSLAQSPPPPQKKGGTPKLYKEGKTSCTCEQMHHVLVVNSYMDGYGAIARFNMYNIFVT